MLEVPLNEIGAVGGVFDAREGDVGLAVHPVLVEIVLDFTVLLGPVNVREIRDWLCWGDSVDLSRQLLG